MFTNEPDDFEELLAAVESVLDQVKKLREEDVKHHLDHIEFFIEVRYDQPEFEVPRGRQALCDAVDLQLKRNQAYTN